MDKKKKRILLGAGTVVLAGAIGAGIYFVQKKDGGEKETLAYVVSVASMNEAAGVQKMAGVVESQETLEIQKDSEREVKEIFVKAGDEVQVGTPLFSYDTETMEGEVQQAQLDLERADNEMANLRTQIAQLEKEKAEAGEEERLSYTTQIQSAQMDLKKSEFERKSKEVELNRLKDKINNSTVTSEMEGVVKSVQSSTGESYNIYDGSSEAFMTILATGEYRVKGTVNEQNAWEIMEGERAIIRSRVNEEETWKGTYTAVDTSDPQSDNSGAMYGISSSDTEAVTSTSYHFYVNLDSSDGLLLGQHVFIEKDTGMEERKGSIWIDEAFLVDIAEKPYVWIENEKGELEKRTVILGAYDEAVMQYEIQEGLKSSDFIAYPQEFIKEGVKTTQDITESSMMEETEGSADTEILEEGGEMPEGELIGGEEGGEMPEGEALPEEEGGEASGEDSESGEGLAEDGILPEENPLTETENQQGADI